MKLYSQALELRALRSIAVDINQSGPVSDLDTQPKTVVATYLMSALSKDSFHYAPCKAAYLRLVSLARSRSRIVSYEDLCEDPVLSSDFRDILSASEAKRVRSLSQARSLAEGLEQYRKARTLYDMSKTIIDQLKSDSVDVDALLEDVTARVTSARSVSADEETIHTVGHNANSDDLVEDAMSEDVEKLLMTGFTELDTRNGGLPAVGVLLIAATTSGGKSVFRMNLCSNLYKLNKVSVCTVSLEMGAAKEVRRMLSHMTQIPFWKYTRKKLTDEDRDISREAWAKFSKIGRKAKARFSILCPKRSMSIQSLLMLTKPYGYNVLAIDYIGLLEGTDGDDQHKVLARITRECKVFSAETNCLVILLAQLDSEDDRIRYSRGILEHVDNCLVWNYSKQAQKDLRVLPVQQKKARDQELFPFDLNERFDVMTVCNPSLTDSGPDHASEQHSEDVQYDVP